jgi:hypothetical protein
MTRCIPQLRRWLRLRPVLHLHVADGPKARFVADQLTADYIHRGYRVREHRWTDALPGDLDR